MWNGLPSTSAARARASSRRRRAAAWPGRTHASPTGCSTSRSARARARRCSRSRTWGETRGSPRLPPPRERPGSARRSPFHSWRAATSSACSPPIRRADPRPGEHETALLAALAGQLAVAVQNAQLHEQATRLGEEREAALAAERAAASRMRALYEVSRSFAQSLRLDETLEALARTVVEVLDIDAAVVRMPDERREQLVPHADPRPRRTVRGPGAHNPHPARSVRPAERAAALP